MSKSTCTACGESNDPDPKPGSTRGLCPKHYARLLKHGDPLAEVRAYRKGGSECEVTDCDKRSKAHNLCPGHLAAARRGAELNGPLRTPRAPACKGPSETAEPCGKPVHSGTLCQAHTWQKRQGWDPLRPIRQRAAPGGDCIACVLYEEQREAVHLGLCYSHYDRKRAGEPDWDRPIKAKAPDGAGHTDKYGYHWIRVDGRSMAEHKHVMAQHLGRSLYLGEEVHHMTGGFAGRSDNRLENLELWTKRHPGGHRVEDVARYCREMLAVYGDDGERVAYEPLMPVEQRSMLMAKGYDPEVAQPETGPADGDEAAA